MMLPEVSDEDVTPSMRRPDVEISRKKGIRIYAVLFMVQISVAVACFLCCIFAIRYDASKKGIPYYTGSLMIAALMLFSSLLAFRIYNKGPFFSVNAAAKKEVTCALNCHHTCSFLLFFGTVVGLALLWMYGLCLGEDKTTCSYGDAHVTENRIISGINFFLGGCALLTSGVGVCLIRKYGRAFELDSRPRQRSSNSNNNSNRLRRTSRMQNVFTLSENSDSVLNNMDGFTNFGYEPPYPLPPYTPTEHAQGTTHVITDIPSEPPPPYKEIDENDVTLEGNTHL